MIYSSPYSLAEAGFVALPDLVRRIARLTPGHPALVDAANRAVL